MCPSDYCRLGQHWHCCSASGPAALPAAPGSGTQAPAVAELPLQRNAESVAQHLTKKS